MLLAPQPLLIWAMAVLVAVGAHLSVCQYQATPTLEVELLFPKDGHTH